MTIRRLFGLIAGGALVLGGVLPTQGCGGGSSGTGAIGRHELAGKAVNSQERPIKNLKIELRSLDGETIAETSTADDGTFALTGIEPRRSVLRTEDKDGNVSTIEIVFEEGSQSATIFMQSVGGVFNSQLDSDPEDPRSRGFSITGNADAGSTIVSTAEIPTVPAAGQPDNSSVPVEYFDLVSASAFSTSVVAIDSLGQPHTISIFYFHTGVSQYSVRAYVSDSEVTPETDTPDAPRILAPEVFLLFGTDGLRVNGEVGVPDVELTIPWSNGAEISTLELDFPEYTSFAAPSNVAAVQSRG